MCTEYDITENLRDAGCDEAEIRSIVACSRRGDTPKAEKLTARCWKNQLKKLHEAQACIDRLDYLSYRLKKG